MLFAGQSCYLSVPHFVKWVVKKTKVFKSATNENLAATLITPVSFSADWETRQVQIRFHTFVIGCESTLTLQNWRWCCYGNCWCCSHLWGALQVKYLIKNFWCMPKLPLWSPYSYVFGAGDSIKDTGLERSNLKKFSHKQTHFYSTDMK